MQTPNQLERLWRQREYSRLVRELRSGRAEADTAGAAGSALAAACWGLIRLDEMNATRRPSFAEWTGVVRMSQDRDGGWRDAPTTALAVRALHAATRSLPHLQPSVERGLAYLNLLQRDDGLWPDVPIRRVAGDAEATLRVLAHLSGDARLRGSVDFARGVQALARTEHLLDPALARRWQRLQPRLAALARHSSRAVLS